MKNQLRGIAPVTIALIVKYFLFMLCQPNTFEIKHKKLISKEIGRPEDECINIHSSPINVLVAALQINHALFFSQSQLIKSKGYPCEEHFVQTTDNFILNIQRIPHGRNKNITRHKPKPVVFLQHGLLADSACWVFDFPKTSLAYILADNGFDVWLGNSRGNRYSRRNKNLSPDCFKFWKWS